MVVTKPQIARRIRSHIDAELYDDSQTSPGAIAIYTLCDPRDLRAIRYVGQTRAPRRRFAQHLNAARLWLPAERPWWIPSPKLRPLYAWIRALYADEQRLPTCVICAWVDVAAARLSERERIRQCLAQGLPLLNIESELLGRQRALL